MIRSLTFLLSFSSFTLGDLQCWVKVNVRNESNPVVNYNQSLTINCLVNRNASDMVITWKKNRETMKNRSSPVLNVTHVKDSTCYTCRVKDDTSSAECEILVQVSSPPQLLLEFYPDHFFIYLKCVVRGYPAPHEVIWYKNDVRILEGVINQKVSGCYGEYVWKKHHPTFNDTGNYSCEAKNVYGKSIAFFFLGRKKLKGLLKTRCPEFRNQSQSRNFIVAAGSTIALRCEVVNAYEAPYGLYMTRNKTDPLQNEVSPNPRHLYKKTEMEDSKILVYTIINATKNDSGSYYCRFLSGQCPLLLLETFFVQVFSPSEVTPKLKKKNLLVAIVVSVAGSFCGLLLVFYVCYLRGKLKSQFYNSCPDSLPELRWDVFVSYSSRDFLWVNELCQMLEEPPFNLTVCLHQRDWELGRTVVDNMVDSVYGSHKTLIVMSNNYVESEYCMQELQIALHSELASDVVTRDKIILVKIDDVSLKRLPRVLRQKSYLDCSNQEHAQHFQINLLRALPRRQLRREDLPHRENDENCGECSSSEARLQQVSLM